MRKEQTQGLVAERCRYEVAFRLLAPALSADVVHSRASALPCQVLFKIRALGEGHTLRNGISEHPAKGWAEGWRGLKLVPRQSLSLQLWEHM